MKEFWTSLASFMGVFAFCQTLLQTIIPPELRFLFAKLFSRLFNWCSSYCYYDITEIDGVNTNELYNAAQLYLSAAAAHSSIGTTRLTLTRAVNSSAVTFGLSNNDRLIDIFNGVPVLWEHVVTHRQSQNFSWRPLPDEKRGFSLRIRKRETILELYLDHIMEKAYEIKRRNQDRFLYTNSRGGSLDSRSHPWESVPFKHPSTFETLAMDPLKKEEIMADLKCFAKGQCFYQKTGRAWKRGYLLYGPPGTGKSSMIAAMANYLGYDIYDLELTEVQNNSELRKLLMKTSSRSIIVIEDIDCSITLTNRKKNECSPDFRGPAVVHGGGGGGGAGDEGTNSITLSGLLNFTDGLWSCCGSEKIFVFTTNHVEKLDPALLRSGRMDMHVFMSYCSFPALKILLKNYLGFNDGDLDENVMKKLEEVIVAAEMTPADVSEVLIKNRLDRDRAVEELIGALKMKVVRNGEKRAQKVFEEEEQEKRTLDSPKEGIEFQKLENVEDNDLKKEEKDDDVEG
ncbi:AAA-ATPase At5g57480-like [Impatiens glandulifera]|uniref:AAA-ATPase At5g57480-like n=1 Tax=Impatiens glandulifera TaxID=253017 RepID=UPI001FB08B7D|nr:AAA-ATPase At5g57480-like [Impatiens glandulifera]